MSDGADNPYLISYFSDCPVISKQGMLIANIRLTSIIIITSSFYLYCIAFAILSAVSAPTSNVINSKEKSIAVPSPLEVPFLKVLSIYF